MRPVNRGSVPKKEDGTDKVYTSYKQAKDDLKNALGAYCSYCEMPIDNQVDIEHVVPKKHDDTLENEWSNFLLACKSCNIIKSNKNIDREGYVFPDTHNTSFLYEYFENNVKVRENLSPDIEKLASATFGLVQLNRKLDTSNMTDDRAWARQRSWQEAKEALNDFLELSENDAMISQTARSCNGFFSMWIQIFKDYPEVKKAILENARGTAIECYDENSTPKPEIMR